MNSELEKSRKEKFQRKLAVYNAVAKGTYATEVAFDKASFTGSGAALGLIFAFYGNQTSTGGSTVLENVFLLVATAFFTVSLVFGLLRPLLGRLLHDHYIENELWQDISTKFGNCLRSCICVLNWSIFISISAGIGCSVAFVFSNILGG